MHDQQHPHVHATHPAIIKRLKKAVGHLNATIAMIESQRSCMELAQQLHAVEKAVASAKRTLIHDHMDHCLDGAIHSDGGRTALDEFKAISKFL